VTKKQSSRMDIGVFHITATGDPAIIAKHAERLGFASYWVPEHSVVPEGSCDEYPGREPGKPPPDYLFELPDPLIALTRASVTTSTIKLGTAIALVPQRSPLTAAKEIASLDHYSGGRFVYGIGAGWNEAECRLMGGDFNHRWTQTEEAVTVMKALWTGEYVEHRGRYFEFPRGVCRPIPSSRPHPTILLGSIGSPRVFERVVRWGDGWLPFVSDPQEIADGKSEIIRHAQDAGRNPTEIQVTALGPEGLFRTREELAELAEAGADAVVIWLQGMDQEAIVAELDNLAGAVFSD
jgi:probable F420-dependent oxidoreductase